MDSSLPLPAYWRTRPEVALDEPTRAAFDAALDNAVRQGPSEPMAYTLSAPKWQFLCYLAEVRGLVLHGSPQPAIAEFEPRQPTDINPFGAQRAVYAAADGIWPIYFAIVDRERYPTSLVNACVCIETPGATLSAPYYLFSVGRHVRDQHPYRDGTVYILPSEGFVPEPPFPFGSLLVHTAQRAGFSPVRPLAKLQVTPNDFPFLSEMLAHDDDRLAEYAQALQEGAPWPE